MKFPEIKEINGAKVFSTNYSNIIKNVKDMGEMPVSRIEYYFYPKNDDPIMPYEVLVNGEIQKSKEIKFNLIKRENSAVNISSHLSTNSAFLGENIVLELNIEYKKDKVARLILNPAKFEFFEITKYEELEPKENNDMILQTARYYIKPKKAGIINISSLVADVIEILENGETSAVTQHSNELSLEVKFPPQNVTLIGNFDIKMSVDKTQIKAGENISILYTITGNGNIKDIDDINLIANNTSIFKDKANINVIYENNSTSGTFMQKFDVVGSDDFIIKGIDIAYFDTTSKEIKHLKTDDIAISVIKEKEDIVQTEKIDKNRQIFGITIAFLLGVFSTLCSVFLYKNKDKIFTRKDHTLRSVIKYYGINKELDEQILKLEDNYKFGKNHKIDMKLISKLVYDIEKYRK